MNQTQQVNTSSRDTQLLIVYCTVGAALLYLFVTYWLPTLWHKLRLQFEQRSVISAVQQEVSTNEVDLSELKELKPRKTDSDSVQSVRKRPTYSLPMRDQITHSSPSSAAKAQSAVAGSKSVMVTTTKPTSLPTSRSSSVDSRVTSLASRSGPLQTFGPNSIEATLYNRMTSEVPPTVLNSSAREDRLLRERQNAELKESEQRDLQRQQEEDKRKAHAAQVEERRRYLVNRIPSEERINPSDKTVTLQFRFRESPGRPDAAGGKASRIKRRFSVTQSTTEDLLLYVESLELRPLLSGTYELTLDFPTRIISPSTVAERGICSLEEAGITTDSVVWVTFSAD